MTEQVQQTKSPMDMVKLVAALTIIVAGLTGFYMADGLPIWARWLLVFAGLAVGGWVGLQSAQGKGFWEFVLSSRVELRKVVWRDKDAPSTFAVTALVIVVVLILTVFFWSVDSGLAYIVRSLLGRGD